MSISKEVFFKEFPEYVNTGYGCHVDDIGGTEGCVWDENRPEDCSIASKGVKKCDCEYWIDDTQPAFYTPDEIWEWLEKAFTPQQSDR